MALGTTNISMTTVRSTLGYTADWSLFNVCISTLINMWSRFKPTRGVNNGNLTLNSNTFWKGSDGRCGLSLPTLPAGSGILNTYTPSNWEYLHPRGGSPGGTPDEPGRLGDFRGYEHDSTLKPPFYSYTGGAGNIVPATITPFTNNEIIA